MALSWVVREAIGIGQEERETDSRQLEEQMQRFEGIKTSSRFEPGRTGGRTALVGSKVLGSSSSQKI